MRWYPSKIDWWIAALLCLAPIAALGGFLVTLAAGGSGTVVAGIGVAVIAAIYLGLVFPMRYAIDESHVIVRYGLVRQRIPLADITEVVPTRNPLSSPALSLDRIRITFGTGMFKSGMISPAAKSEFLDELAAKAKLRRDGDRLVR
jgi:hypothetical protein